MNKLSELLNAGFSGIWLDTVEPNEAATELRELCAAKALAFHEWDIDRGMNGSQEIKDPLSAIAQATHHASVYAFHNLHRFLDSPIVVQALFNKIIEGKTTQTALIILAPTIQIPIELQKHLIVVEHDLPTKEQLSAIAASMIDPNTASTFGLDNAQMEAASGLTRYEAEGAFALSMVRHKKIDAEAIYEIKAGTVKKSGLMEMHRNGCSFNDLGGLHALKHFCKCALSSQQHRARGVLLLGVPGTGKSAFAKALGDELGRPTLLLDLGALMGSLVGQTEANIRQALKIADAMQPCILFVDEIEKALAGSSAQHSGDSGVSARMLGSLLTWLSDHTSDVFFIATANDIEALSSVSSGAFTRAERFDAVWFLDLPTREQRKRIWEIHLARYSIPFDGPLNDPVDADHELWTGAEIAACCRLAALLDISLQDAAKYVVPVAVTATDKIEKLRAWASSRCLDAENGGVYQTNKPATRRRHIQS